MWFPYCEAAAQLAHLAIAGLDAFPQGYVEGWIPNAWITLGRAPPRAGRPAHGSGRRPR